MGYGNITGASPGFGRGGGQEIFFFRFGNLHVAKRHAAHGKAMRIARGVRGHAPPRKFLKRCNLVHFRVYFHQILYLFFFKDYLFYIKNNYFRYTLAMGYISREEIFENMLRLMCFDVYFETKMAIFIKK